MRATLEETLRLLAGQLHLFTLLSLTVWLPTHVFLNYLEFFAREEASPVRSLHVGLLVQMVFDPLVVSAALVALARIKQGLPVAYWPVLGEGARAWSRLLFVRLIVTTAVLLPAAAGSALARSGRGGLAAGALLLVLLTVMLLVRFAVVDSVVVLEGRTVLTCWRRAAELTSGRRWTVLWTAALLFGLVSSVAVLAALAFKAAPELNHFVVRVLFDCMLSVGQSLFTIALFLIYWRARPDRPGPALAV